MLQNEEPRGAEAGWRAGERGAEAGGVQGLGVTVPAELIEPGCPVSRGLIGLSRGVSAGPSLSVQIITVWGSRCCCFALLLM